MQCEPVEMALKLGLGLGLGVKLQASSDQLFQHDPPLRPPGGQRNPTTRYSSMHWWAYLCPAYFVDKVIENCPLSTDIVLVSSDGHRFGTHCKNLGSFTGGFPVDIAPAGGEEVPMPDLMARRIAKCGGNLETQLSLKSSTRLPFSSNSTA